MFDTKFAMQSVGFEGLLEEVNSTNPTSALRAQGFLKFLSDALGWFEKYPAMAGLKIVAFARPEVNLETNVDVRIRHHINLTVDGADTLFQTEQERQEHAEISLPYNTMGAGVFELNREHAAVQRYLQLDASETAAYVGVLQVLAHEMDMAFGRVFVYHDYGIASAG